MPIDYDLVVIGGTPAGIEAATVAASLNARVALVDHGLAIEALSDSVQRLLWQEAGQHFGDRLDDLGSWFATAAHQYAADHSRVGMAAQGIDVIAGRGEFIRRRQLGVGVGDRLLVGRSYLVAVGDRPLVPGIDGLESVSYLFPNQVLSKLTAMKPGSHWVIIGRDRTGVELAQMLNRLGFRVSLVTRQARLLPECEDATVTRRIQAQLEAEGVTILTQTTISQIRQIQQQVWVQAGNVALEADSLVLATRPIPNVAGINFATVGVRVMPQGIPVNSYLRTPHSQIYACSRLINGQVCPTATPSLQSAIAVGNALGLSRKADPLLPHPQIIYTDPEVAWVGLSEAQAIQRYGKNVRVWEQIFQPLTASHSQAGKTGLCRIITQRSTGKILGGQLVGVHAGEMIGAIATAIDRPLSELTCLRSDTPTMTDVLGAIAQASQAPRPIPIHGVAGFLHEFKIWWRLWSDR